MINKSNDLPSFVNETNLPKIVDKLTDAKNIKISNNKYGNRVQTVIDKIVEKADDITKAIKQEVINDSYSFKVGTGDVDVSADVEDGFGEIGVKGVTYQNILSKDSKNARQFIQKDLNARVKALNSNLIKSSTKYTLVFDVTQINLAGLDSIGLYIQGSITDSSMVKVASVSTVGIYKYVFTSSSKAITNNYFDLKGHASQWENDSTTTSRTLTLANVMLIEGEIDQPTSYFEDIVGVGDKSKNLFNPKSVKFGITLNTNTGEEMNSNVYVTSDFIPVLEKTDYTVKGLPVIHYYNESKEQIAVKNTPVEGVIRTPQNCKWIRMRNYDQILITEQKLLIKKSSFILGTYDIFEPYYDGHKIEILSNGKNIFNTDLLKKDSAYMSNLFRNQFDFQGWAIISMSNEQVRKILKPNTTYTLSFKARMLQKMGTVQVYRYEVGMMFYHQDASPIHFGTCKTNSITQVNDEKEMQVTFTTPGNLDKYELRVYSNRYAQGETIQTDIVRFFDMQIEENISKTSFEYYQQDKTQILLDEPLMRLPNGVCDEITRDRKLIRRVGKVVLDGSEDWKVDLCLDKENKYFSAILDAKLMVNSYYENVKMASLLVDNPYTVTDKICISVYPQDGIVARVQHPSLDKTTPNSIKEWLSQNPVTIYYQLETPIITDIVPPTLRIFKDGHITFDTLVAPESSHLVQLNKSGQIQNAIKESQSLDNRINVLENNYDNLMLSTISRLNDLELNYTLK